jgi:predicted DsbA family dithiol-disulfide isomerase
VDAAEPLKFDVFYDYQCPFVYRAFTLLDTVRAMEGHDIEVGWRYFSLTQVNSKDEGWTLWDAPASELVRGRLAFAAAESARRQGRFAVMHAALLRARHRDRLDLDDREVVEGIAEASGLDMDRFRTDVEDPAILERLRADHTFATTELGVFGTPTLVFAGGTSAYVRLAEPVEGPDAVHVFDDLLTVAAREPRILEIKRPRKPA